MSTQHTPGPWSALARGALYELHAENDMIGIFKGTLIHDRKNARLIAAAPELLSALRQALPLLQELHDAEGYSSTTAHRALEAARSAIAKTEGAHDA